MSASRKLKVSESAYQRFFEIDGTHSLRTAVPELTVSYRTKVRKNGKVAYFNFNLAKEMGLIENSHDHKMNPELENIILDRFSIQIINEWDLENRPQHCINADRGESVFATRYLQLQHPNKQGKTSGDGRAIWNGELSNYGKHWDISSCGTGATILSPAQAVHERYFRTGDPSISYGCGLADTDENVGAALMSEIMHNKGLPTERILAVITYPNGSSVRVRAAQSLLRPAHFFRLIKLGDHENLEKLVRYYMRKESLSSENKMLESIINDFAETFARFEANYIFCWADWDGDNILMNSGIIDYGSIRQFGVCHSNYRFDDDTRWSTTLKEQRIKARYMMQTFVQGIDFVKTGKKKNIKQFYHSKVLKAFDQIFEKSLNIEYLKKWGFGRNHIDTLLECHPRLVKKLKDTTQLLESSFVDKEAQRTSDGITQHPAYSLRKLQFALLASSNPSDLRELLSNSRTTYAIKSDYSPTETELDHLKTITTTLSKLDSKLAKKLKTTRVYLQRSRRVRLSDRLHPCAVTGDAVIEAVQKLMSKSKSLSTNHTQELKEHFIDYFSSRKRSNQLSGNLKKIFNKLKKKVEECSESL